MFEMKRKLLLPGVACAVASSLLLCVALADHDKTHKDSAISQPHKMMKLSQAQGAQVLDRQNNNVGTIRDLVAEPDSGRIHFAILSLTGAEAVGKLTAVPWSSLHQQSPNTFVLQADKETLRTARSFTQDHWPDFSQRDVADSYYTHYGLTYDRRADAGGRVTLPSGMERSSAEVYYEEERETFFPRPQPDGHSTFPHLNRGEKDW